MVVDIGEVKRHIKPKADSTLRNMRKEDLIEYIRCLENNYNVAVSFNENQAKYIESLGFFKMDSHDPSDLISRSRLLRDPYFQEGRYPESHLLRMAIGEQPPVKFVKLVHGKTEEINPCNITVDRQCCSCGTAMGKEDNFCPHCGAMMNGGTHGKA